ncbi:MAG: biopolymer transporter ExbD [Blastocatellia bacterium AA13]|nr:MAG: biopolymer transporter ExbD [Blastocatellia bacterium AA13]
MAFTNRQGRTQTSLAEINVTPLVDVMLVLLVIFMVTAPILQTGIEVNLPKTRETQVEQPKPKAVVLSIDKDGNVYLSTKSEARAVNVNDLPKLLTDALGESGERKVYVRGDGETPYRIIAFVLASFSGLAPAPEFSSSRLERVKAARAEEAPST